MKKTFIGIVILFIFSSCTKPEDTVTEIVDKFLTEMNDPEVRKNGIDFSVLTDDYLELFQNNSYYLMENWELTAKKESDTTFMVEAVGKTSNAFGMTLEKHKGFALKKVEGDWKIFSSYKLIADEINFEVVDTQWDFYWDTKKARILKEVQDSLKLEVKRKGYKSYFGDAVKGELRLVNNTNYDLKRIKILIEHFDKNGKSVNTDIESMYDIIRAGGYREFDWYTSDCSKCSTQEFTINFIKESH